MQNSRGAATMTDVALKAGVSHQTVSRVLNNHPSVTPATRQKVTEAMAALGYRRNLAARALATGSSRIIGVLVSSTSLSGPSGTLLAIEPIARGHDYWMSMAGLKSGDPAEVGEIVSHFTDQGVDAIIAVAQTQRALDAMLSARISVPTILITSGHTPANFPRVDIDQADGVRQIMTLLRGLGHRRIAHIAGPVGDLHGEARAAAWREHMGEPMVIPASTLAPEPPMNCPDPTAKRGSPSSRDETRTPRSLCPDTTGLLVRGDWSAASGYRAAMSLLGLDDLPTAIFAANDRMAYGVLRALSERGLSVPRDVSVVGFDDLDGSDCTIPPLTTVRQDHAALGAATMELLLEAMAGAPARSIDITPSLTVRASTAMAR
jgi:DNA-binding LacI/PurR family transcriptional regulator